MTETRAEKAQRLVDEGRVIVILQPDYGTYAIVMGDSRRHVTHAYADGRFFCSCPWGNIHSWSDDLCAHALAAKLAVEQESVP